MDRAVTKTKHGILPPKYVIISGPILVVIFGFCEFHYFPFVYNAVYWHTQLPSSLLMFSGVIIGFSIVGFSFVLSIRHAEITDRSTRLGVASIGANLEGLLYLGTAIAALNIFSYFFRYDWLGHILVFLEIFLLPAFFIILFNTIRQFSAYYRGPIIKAWFKSPPKGPMG